MAEISIRFLGETQVTRDGIEQALPPSKKTRALLAYLAMTGKSFRREVLCELLWELPDDPRGSLRWSLSKLRKLVDDDNNQRIIADRANVAFNTETVTIDAVQLIQFSKSNLNDATVDELFLASQKYEGEFLSGLDLDKFHDFYSWRIAEQENIRAAQIAIEHALVNRLPDAEAIKHARKLISLDPSNINHHNKLIQLLSNDNRRQDAQQQLSASKHLLNSLGVSDLTSLYRASQTASAGSSNTESTATTRNRANGEKPKHRMLGRDAEITTLVTEFERCCDFSAAKLVLISGEPGIGKSRLTQGAYKLAKKTDAWLLRSEAFESAFVRPYSLWLDAFRRSESRTIPEELNFTENNSRDAIFSRINEIVNSRLDSSPVIIILDDIHWADESSLAILHYLIKMNCDKPLFILAAARSNELNQNSAALQTFRDLRKDNLIHDIPLSPLNESDLQALITECSPKADAKKISLECHGNPLLAIELSRAENESENLHSLSETVQERYSRMQASAQKIVDWASILDPKIDETQLSRLSGLDDDTLASAIEEAEAQGILKSVEFGLSFSHNLIRQCVYLALSATRRNAMHKQVAQNLEIDTASNINAAADLAHHAEKSGDLAMATRAMISAGRLCLRFFANDDAVRLADKGLAMATQLSDCDRICLSIELTDVKWNAAPIDDWETAADNMVELAEQALDFGANSHARLGYQIASYLRWVNGQWQGAHNDSMLAEQVARGGSDHEHIQGLAESARCLALLERDLPKADGIAMEATSLAKRQNIYIGVLPLAKGILSYYRGNFDEAEELLQEARTYYKSRGDRAYEFQANEYLVMLEIERENWPQVKRHSKHLSAIGEKLKEGSEGPLSRVIAALCDYALNEHMNEDKLDCCLEELRVADAKHRLAYSLTRAAKIDLRNHNYKKSKGRTQEALSYTRLLNRPSEKFLSLAVLATALSSLDEPKLLEECITEIRQLKSSEIANWALAQASPFLE